MKRIPPPEPGLYPNVPDEVYRSWDAINASTLVRADLSMAHVLHELEHGDTSPSPAKTAGTAFHAMLFEPDDFEAKYIVEPRGTTPETSNKDGTPKATTKEGKAIWAEWEASRNGREVLTMATYEEIAAWVAAVARNPHALKLVEDCEHYEVSGVWIDPQTGEVCKCRFDGIARDQMGRARILDCKSTVCAKPGPFADHARRLHYPEKFAWYRWGLECIIAQAATIYVDVLCVDVIAIEKKTGFVKTYVAHEEMLGFGFGRMRNWLDDYAMCRQTGQWPDYGPTEPLNLPEWFMRRLETQAADREAEAEDNHFEDDDNGSDNGGGW